MPPQKTFVFSNAYRNVAFLSLIMTAYLQIQMMMQFMKNNYINKHSTGKQIAKMMFELA